MKKYNVSIDFVAFGELDDSVTKKLEAFNENVTGGTPSHLAIIPPGPGLLSDQLVTSPIINGEGGGAGMGGAAGEAGQDASSFEYGVDPSVDPELALALRMSMEEEKARVDKQNKEKAEKDKEALPEIKEEDEAGQGSSKDATDVKKDEKKDDDAMDTA